MKHGDRITLGRTITLEFQDTRPLLAGTLLDGASPITGLSGAGNLQPQVDQTFLGTDPNASTLTDPPRLTIVVAGGSIQTYPLAGARILIGRADDP